MDEKVLFERMHDALDIEPRPGAYERLRIALAKSPARPHRWPVMRIGGSKMGFRLAAGLAVIALAAAIVAAFVAVHNTTTSNVPAGTALTVQAYQKLVADDDATAIATWSSPCDTTTHTGCQADATRALVALQHWLDDLNRTQPPSRFVVVDAQLRLHLAATISGLNALLAAGQAQDSSGIDRAYLLALDGRAWTDTVVPGIVSSQQVNAVAYVNSVRAQGNAMIACTSCQILFGPTEIECAQDQAPNCQDLLDGTAGPVARFQFALIASSAPASLSAADTRLQHDLAQADSALVAMRAALSIGDQAGFSAGRDTLRSAFSAVNLDVSVI